MYIYHILNCETLTSAPIQVLLSKLVFVGPPLNSSNALINVKLFESSDFRGPRSLLYVLCSFLGCKPWHTLPGPVCWWCAVGLCDETVPGGAWPGPHAARDADQHARGGGRQMGRGNPTRAPAWSSRGTSWPGATWAEVSKKTIVK